MISLNPNRWIVLLILMLWFVISFVTNILGPIMPALIETYHISLTMAAFLPFSFFLAYGIMSIPAGLMMETYGPKFSIAVALSINLTGSVMFAFFPYYPVALVSLFMMGMGMAVLQVIINPLMRVAGGEENFAFYSVLGQAVFGGASFLSPYFFVYLTRAISRNGRHPAWANIMPWLAPSGKEWIALYWVFGLIFSILWLSILIIDFPALRLKAEEKAGTLTSYGSLLGKRSVWVYFLGILSYVGVEQGIADWMTKFLALYHGINPLREGAAAIAWFWGSMALGCLMGLVLLRLFDSKWVLVGAVLSTFFSLTLALVGSAGISVVAFAGCGFCISLIFSIVFSLALNSVPTSHGSFSGILCSGIFGGALIPLFIGAAGDHFGLRPAMFFLYLPLGFILYIAFWARPITRNKTVSWQKLLGLEPV